MRKIILALAVAFLSFNLTAQTTQKTMVRDGGSGPYKAVVCSDASLPDYGIYRPDDMDAAVKAEGKLPVIVYGNGGCIPDARHHEILLTELASYGYFIIVIGPVDHSPEYDGDKIKGSSEASLLVKAMDWAQNAAVKKGGEYRKKIDTDKIVAMGQSCGGLQALTAAVDPRVKTAVIFNSGTFENPVGPDGKPSPSMASTLGREGLSKLHTPVVYIIGGPDDIAYKNATADYELINNVPLVLMNLPVGHSAEIRKPHAGQWAVAARKWLDWQIKGRTQESSFFLDENITKAYDPEWTVQRKNF